MNRLLEKRRRKAYMGSEWKEAELVNENRGKYFRKENMGGVQYLSFIVPLYGMGLPACLIITLSRI